MLNRRTLIAALSACALSLPAAQAQEGGSYILATATTGGTYYPVGVALATLTKVKLEPSQKIGMSAISSAGSGENVRLMREGEAQFSLLQGLYGYYAAKGVGPVAADGPQKNILMVATIWPNVEHMVISADKATTGTIDDMVALKGESMALGAPNSGAIGSAGAILGGLGL
ncbi:MAG: C4-dicarboxylate ABC transporter substrate-binding protein, partial [Alphaproteobacteria bacterium HGW-Alphaproteobacteria-8]